MCLPRTKIKPGKRKITKKQLGRSNQNNNNNNHEKKKTENY